MEAPWTFKRWGLGWGDGSVGKVLLGKCENLSLDSQPAVAVDACHPRAGGQGQEDPRSSPSGQFD